MLPELWELRTRSVHSKLASKLMCLSGTSRIWRHFLITSALCVRRRRQWAEGSSGRMATLPQDIRIGTSGWRFEDWAGTFYPLRVPQTKWLEYYAARFPVG